MKDHPKEEVFKTETEIISVIFLFWAENESVQNFFNIIDTYINMRNN